MPWTLNNPPKVAKNWPRGKQIACVRAANARLARGGDNAEEEAIRACIAAAKQAEKSSLPPTGDTMDQTRVVDLFMADRVLAGDWVRILPLMETGYWRGGSLKPPITEDKAQAMVANFDKRAESGLYQSNIPINIEHVDTEGKIGTVAGLKVVGGDGVYAKLDLNNKGRRLLEEDAFDYLSPEIVWDFEDSRTGEPVGPTVVGLAVTNYPYFGNATAMYSREAGERYEEANKSGENIGSALERMKDRIVAELAAMFSRQPAEPGEVHTMEGNQGNGTEFQVPEEFASRMADLEERMARQQEEFTRQIQERDNTISTQTETIQAQSGRIGELESSNLRQRFSRQVDSLPHVGANNESLVEELMWLYQADSGDREHYGFWSTLLGSFEQSMASSDSFREVGQGGGSTPAGAEAMAIFDAKVRELAKARGITAAKGTAEYARLLMEVAAAEPQLYARYENERATL